MSNVFLKLKLHMSSEYSASVKLLNRTIFSRVDPKDPGSRLLRAAEHNQIEIINELLSADPSLVHTTDTDGYTPLHRAAYSNQMEAVKVRPTNCFNS